jgi:hypothetical protein
MIKLLPTILLLAAFILPVAAHAADDDQPKLDAAGHIAVPAQDPADLDKRIELAKQWHKLMPVSVHDQIDNAIDEVAKSQPENQREVFKANMRSVLNYEALEKISIDAMAEVYTAAELQAMVDYNSKPEARSAQEKYPAYASRVFPEITKMLDQAVMRVRTGDTGNTTNGQ